MAARGRRSARQKIDGINFLLMFSLFFGQLFPV
jgi:hypothetical protein